MLQVASAENAWGSIAAQLGGTKVHVVSIITNPDTDPHDYEPTAVDARTVAEAQLVIENGLGYDPWMSKLVAADDSSAAILNVGSALGLGDTANPHRWYNPADVRSIVARIAAEYIRLDPSDRSYFQATEARFNDVDLADYDTSIATIRSTFAGTPVGASESIFAMLAPALGLDLVTPPSFLRAVSEGSDVSVGDKEAIDRQIRDHQIAIYVYNTQNLTPDVQTQLVSVRRQHIPVATITETLEPANDTFQAWQVRQLRGIAAALAEARAGTRSRPVTKSASRPLTDAHFHVPGRRRALLLDG